MCLNIKYSLLSCMRSNSYWYVNSGVLKFILQSGMYRFFSLALFIFFYRVNPLRNSFIWIGHISNCWFVLLFFALIPIHLKNRIAAFLLLTWNLLLLYTFFIVLKTFIVIAVKLVVIYIFISKLFFLSSFSID